MTLLEQPEPRQLFAGSDCVPHDCVPGLTAARALYYRRCVREKLIINRRQGARASLSHCTFGTADSERYVKIRR